MTCADYDYSRDDNDNHCKMALSLKSNTHEVVIVFLLINVICLTFLLSPCSSVLFCLIWLSSNFPRAPLGVRSVFFNYLCCCPASNLSHSIIFQHLFPALSLLTPLFTRLVASPRNNKIKIAFRKLLRPYGMQHLNTWHPSCLDCWACEVANMKRNW